MVSFDGQQTDERILYVISPHEFSRSLAIAKLLFLSLFFYLMIWFIAGIVSPSYALALTISGAIVSFLLVIIGVWWNQKVYKESKTYITDRRIIRFDIVSPFFQTKRVLFWNEALKAKAFAPNMLYRILRIGTVQVEPHLTDSENVRVTNVYFYDDLANYIDKILYIVKNKPEELQSLQPFVPKPRGERA